MNLRRTPVVAVVGGGLAGLSAAKAMVVGTATATATAATEQKPEPRVRVVVVEASEETLGGRTGGFGSGGADAGAQYFTATSREMRSQVDEWRRDGVVEAWKPRIGVVGADGAWGGAQAEKGPERFVGVPSMRAMAVAAAASLRSGGGGDVRVGHFVRSVERGDDGMWRLDGVDGVFDAVVVALPAPLAADLLRNAHPRFAEVAASHRMRPSWAVCVSFAAPARTKCDAAFVNAGSLRWVARDSSKPSRSACASDASAHGGEKDVWVLHANATWSRDNANKDAAAVTHELLRAFSELPLWDAPMPALLSPPHTRWWPHADTENPSFGRDADDESSGFVWDSSARLGMCGDWLNGSKVEGAWVSGSRLGRAVSSSSFL